MDSKTCIRCKAKKEISNFGKRSVNKDGYNDYCKSCISIYHKEKAYHKTDKNKLYVKNYEQEHKIEKKEYYNRTKDHWQDYQRKYKREKYANDILYRLKSIISSSIHQSLKRKNFKKSKRTIEMLGCTVAEFKLYLESKFEPWMSWENQGRYNGESNYGWDIDHIIPVYLCKTEEEVIKSNHFSNLQPLCSKINRDIKWRNYESENLD